MSTTASSSTAAALVHSADGSQVDQLDGLHSLEVLDLACNRLRDVGNLQALHRLRRLNLSYNRIGQLEGLAALRGPDYSLEYIDLRDNQLQR